MNDDTSECYDNRAITLPSHDLTSKTTCSSNAVSVSTLRILIITFVPGRFSLVCSNKDFIVYL